jgi:hypothetical protein
LILKETRKALLAGMIALSCFMLLSGGFLPLAYAADGVFAIPSSAPQGSIIGVQNVLSSSGETLEQFFTAVITPSGSILACTFNLLSCPITAVFGGPGGTVSCTIPYGGLGTYSSAGTVGLVSIFPLGACDSPFDNNVAWGVTSGIKSSDLQGLCDSRTSPSTTGGSTGSTSEIGTYNVVTCWVNQNPNVPGGQFFQTTFNIVKSTAVPEFPLGMVAVVGVAMAAVVVLRTGIRKRDVPSVFSVVAFAITRKSIRVSPRHPQLA